MVASKSGLVFGNDCCHLSFPDIIQKFLNSVMQAELEPIRTRRKEWEQRLPEVVEILKEGSAYAEKTAAATLAEVRKSMRIDYFENDNLLK